MPGKDPVRGCFPARTGNRGRHPSEGHVAGRLQPLASSRISHPMAVEVGTQLAVGWLERTRSVLLGRHS